MFAHYQGKFEKLCLCSLTLFLLFAFKAQALTVVDLVKQTTPSVVAIGIKTPLEYQGSRILGTGFVVGNGKYVVTNYHVVSEPLAVDIVQHYVALSGLGQDVTELKAEIVGIDPVHDIALLRTDKALPALSLGENEFVDIGVDIMFTGFPIGAVLGLYPATHKGSIAAITPDAIPAHNADVLTVNLLKRLKKPSLIYQLDATAYPGNSGSPVFSQDSDKVIAIINKVIVKGGKENALSSPSGISYAVPVQHIRALGAKHSVDL